MLKSIVLTLELKVKVLEPRLIVLTLEFEDAKVPAVILKLAVVNVPCVTVRDLENRLSASPSVSVMPEPLTVTPLNVLPAVVSVPVPVNVIVPVWVYVIAATSVTLPATVIAAVPVMVPAKPVQLMLAAPVFPAAIVQVPVDRLVKNTASEAVGRVAPPGPPDVADHLVPAVSSQEAVPPTQ